MSEKSSVAPTFKFLCNVQLQAKRQWVYAISFWPNSTDSTQVFGACGSRFVSILEIHPNQPQFKVVRSFFDEDEKEDFYTLVWTHTTSMIPLLCVGGESGTIKILNADECVLHSFLQGHGGPVYDLQIHPRNVNLLFSCSKDESIRIWSIRDRRCLVLFAGDQGHRDSVLSISIHQNGLWLASCGCDNSIKVWDLDCDRVKQGLVSAEKPTPAAVFVQFPVFSTRRVHTDYVDCVEWVGDLLLTKSVGSEILLWKPDMRRRTNGVVQLAKYAYANGENWFVRFGVSFDFKQIAVGDDVGRVHLFALAQHTVVEPSTAAYQVLTTSSEKPVRNCTFSPNREYVVCGGDDGFIYCFYNHKE